MTQVKAMKGVALVELVTLWARQVASGMAYLHGLQPAIVHRDLKPANSEQWRRLLLLARPHLQYWSRSNSRQAWTRNS